MNYLLDTNVVSELIRPEPDPNVTAWISATDEDRLHLSVLTFAEIRHGIERLPEGSRRERLTLWMETDLTERFAGRVLELDRAAAEAWGVMMARAAAGGMRLPAMDTLFAATAERHGMVLATRNIRDFRGAGIELLDPWQPRESRT
ncbi:type II toxin-antitoxin system VapC family toxin [Arenibaculum sp.]|uniref:type II toxin-antitoxin system VapC family toxin n=1 Tax=Arenibaculum sp. TaxID=2865862 RepID=UPI002E13758F|nr:type II toxin-antitoxin system VapC family toxin [Arenibaculum sp.]